MARRIQIGQDGRIRVKGGKIILARDLDPCCCGEDGGPLYARVRDCCNFNRVLWVLVSMVGPCSTIQRVSVGGSVECWTLDTAQEPLTAAQIADAFPGDPIDAPDTLEPYPCGTCGVAPCPTCPECCIPITVPDPCPFSRTRCCNMGRAFRARWSIVKSILIRWQPNIFICNDALHASEAMFAEREQLIISQGTYAVQRRREGNVCLPIEAVCEIGSTRRREVEIAPGSCSIDPGSCVISCGPRQTLLETDETVSDCWGNPFDVESFLPDLRLGNVFDAYGDAFINIPCEPNPAGGTWPLSGSWSAVRDVPGPSGWHATAQYSRTMRYGCDGASREEDYVESYTWNGLPQFTYTATGTLRASVAFEIVDPNCGSDPCPPPGGLGGAGNGVVYAGNVWRPARAYGTTGVDLGGGCSGCGQNAGVRVATAEEMAMLLRLAKGT